MVNVNVVEVVPLVNDDVVLDIVMFIPSDSQLISATAPGLVVFVPLLRFPIVSFMSRYTSANSSARTLAPVVVLLIAVVVFVKLTVDDEVVDDAVVADAVVVVLVVLPVPFILVVYVAVVAVVVLVVVEVLVEVLETLLVFGFTSLLMSARTPSEDKERANARKKQACMCPSHSKPLPLHGASHSVAR